MLLYTYKDLCYSHFRRNKDDNLQKYNDTVSISLSIMHREIFQLKQGTGYHKSLLLLLGIYLKWEFVTNASKSSQDLTGALFVSEIVA